MTRDEAASILGIDDDTADDLEDVLEIDGNWTVIDLQRAAHFLDSDQLEVDE